MPWPQPILTQFQMLPEGQNLPQGVYHGPYNKLLSTLFPVTSDFTVFSNYLPNSRNAADFIVMYYHDNQNRPVLVLELKPDYHYDSDSRRQMADYQIRDRIGDLIRQWFS